MTVKATKPAINLRSEIASQRGRAFPRRHVFWMDGDGSKTDFRLPAGWEPYAASVEGLDQRRGKNEAWEASFDGFVWTVVFDVAPGVVSVGIHCESEV